ncbi:hypothetical protein WICPIJ_002393 [Wickerhamomyces pijperi]|uniref:DUF202 domain-containing protein n=1 Tax=Wickerhamomyces pijperi TaxID=599730 RepID=A0A9P8TP06_WICPI|nr:hypothetical protein WICPIJ_002393 [Wickerhamomyces pijperi]
MLIDWYHKLNPEEGRVSRVVTSLPRDCLQAERSILQYSKFAATLGFASLAVLLNFKFVYEDSVKGLVFKQTLTPSVFALVVSVVFFILSISSLVLGVANYYTNIRCYMEGHTRTGSRKGTNLFVFLVVLCLIGVNITLLIDSSHWAVE